MDRKKHEKLKWFFEFLSIDFSKMSDSEYQRTCAELMFNILGLQIGLDSEIYNDKLKLGFIEMFDKVTTEINGDPIKRVYGATLKEFQETLINETRPLFEQIEEIISGRNIEKVDPIGVLRQIAVRKIDLYITENKPLFTLNPERREKVAPYILIDEGFLEKEVKTIAFSFLQCLDGIPVNAFDKCSECGSWFIKLRESNSKFCSDKCRNRFNQRKRRKSNKNKNPKQHKKELKEAAERQRNNYERQLQKDLSPNVKIKKRPRKYKEE